MVLSSLPFLIYSLAEDFQILHTGRLKIMWSEVTVILLLYCDKHLGITARQSSMLASLPRDEYGHLRTLEIRVADKTLHRDQSHVEELFLHLDGIQ